jgi:hypothetical protein
MARVGVELMRLPKTRFDASVPARIPSVLVDRFSLCGPHGRLTVRNRVGVALCDECELGPRLLPIAGGASGTYRDRRRALQEQLVHEALAAHGNQVRAARALGVGQATISRVVSGKTAREKFELKIDAKRRLLVLGERGAAEWPTLLVAAGLAVSFVLWPLLGHLLAVAEFAVDRAVDIILP